MEDEIKLAIIELLQPLCPNIDLKHGYSAYYTTYLDEIIQSLIKANNAPLALSYPEIVRVNILNDVVEQIKIDLIKNRRDYLYQEDNPKDDYERGVLNVIRLIQYRVHCICD